MPIYGNMVQIQLESMTFESIFNEFDTSIYSINEGVSLKGIGDKIKDLFTRFIEFLKKVKVKLMQFFNKHFGLFKKKLEKLKEAEDKAKKDKSNNDRKDSSTDSDDEIEISYKNYIDALNKLSDNICNFAHATSSINLSLILTNTLEHLDEEKYNQEIDNTFLEFYEQIFGFKFNEYNSQDIKNTVNDYFKSIEEMTKEVKTKKYKRFSIESVKDEEIQLDIFYASFNKKCEDRSKSLIDSIESQISLTEKKKKEYEQQKISDEPDNVKKYAKVVNFFVRYINHYKELLGITTDFYKFAMKIYNEALNEENAYRAKISKFKNNEK